MRLLRNTTARIPAAICVLVLFYVVSCREKYVPQLINEPTTGYLVVDGFINSGSGPTTISLSRSTKLSAAAAIVRETKATVRVVGKTNTLGFALAETGAGTGVYSNPQLTLNPSDQYRLYIKTSAGKEYYSDFSDVRRTPDIDSVSWRPENGGVQIYANTHNTAQGIGYYQFKFDETWEFYSWFLSYYKVYYNAFGTAHLGFRDSATRNFDPLMYRCWKSEVPTDIRVYSTEKLTQNIVSLYPLVFIEPESWKLGVRYSTLLKSYALSKENYKFLEQLRKNTEQLGSIFDAQPSEMIGNIHNPINLSETVIGFVEITEEKQKRIFITRADVPFWIYSNRCGREYKVANTPEKLTAAGIPTVVADYNMNTGAIDSIYFAESLCVDCTLRGSNKKPLFWP